MIQSLSASQCNEDKDERGWMDLLATGSFFPAWLIGDSPLAMLPDLVGVAVSLAGRLMVLWYVVTCIDMDRCTIVISKFGALVSGTSRA